MILGRSEIRSQFIIIEKGNGEKSYCNTNRPPEKIKSEENNIMVIFRRYEDNSKRFMGREGFRLKYTTRNNSLEKWTDKEYSLEIGKNASLLICWHIYEVK